MKQHISITLLALSLLATATVVQAKTPGDQFDINEGVVTVIVAGDRTSMNVIWISDPDVELISPEGTRLTAQWSGPLTAAEKVTAADVLASHDVDCYYRIWKPWKERGQYHTFVKNKSRQHCQGSDVRDHYTGLNLQARPNSDEFFYTQETGKDWALNFQAATVNLSHQCVLRGPYQWRSEGWGTVYFRNDVRPLYLPVVRTGHRNFCF
jgi:hypothetical protein